MSRFDAYPGSVARYPWRQSVRARLFLLVFGIVFAVGLVYMAFLPAEYRSSATVLMTAQRAIDAQAAPADIQRVAIQRKILLGTDITAALAAEMADRESVYLSAGEVRSLLQVAAVPDTDLVEMSAQGERSELLPVLVNRWIDVYLAVRADDIEQRKQHTLQVVQGQLDGLATRLEAARDALAQYRQEHGIISMERQENEVLARLDGLNRALNNAIEAEARTGAYLDTLRQGITRGEQIVPRGEQRAVEAMGRELRELQAQYAELGKRYTAQYIEKQPQWRAIPERIEKLKTALAKALSQGSNVELDRASQEHAAAQQTVADLQHQLDEHKQRVAQFNTIYARHQALAEDLAGLEQLNRDTQARMVQVEVQQVEKYPQVSVIERPDAESERIGPDYLLLFAFTLGAALGLAVFSVWLTGFLSPPTAGPAYVTLSGVHMYPREASRRIADSDQAPAGLADDRALQLAGRDDPPASAEAEQEAGGKNPPE